MDSQGELLLAFVEALDHRLGRALRGAPTEFPGFRAVQGMRTPHEIVAHVNLMLELVLGRVSSARPPLEPLLDFGDEVARCHALLGSVARQLAAGPSLPIDTAQMLVRGPLADAMTHVGQIAILRRLAGSPLPPLERVP